MDDLEKILDKLLEANEVGDKKAVRERSIELYQIGRTEHENARIDPLTGLKNQRWYDENVKKNGVPHPYAILIIDIDKFKQINDKEGHPGANKILNVVSKVIEDTVRKSDFVTRYGGDELIVLLNNARGSSSYQVAEAIRRNIENAGLPYDSKVTVSIGVASSDIVKKEELSELEEEADKALYKAKEERNQVAVANGDGDYTLFP